MEYIPNKTLKIVFGKKKKKKIVTNKLQGYIYIDPRKSIDIFGPKILTREYKELLYLTFFVTFLTSASTALSFEISRFIPKTVFYLTFK